MPPTVFEPAIPASKRPFTHPIDRVATGTGTLKRVIGFLYISSGLSPDRQTLHLNYVRSSVVSGFKWLLINWHNGMMSPKFSKYVYISPGRLCGFYTSSWKAYFTCTKRMMMVIMIIIIIIIIIICSGNDNSNNDVMSMTNIVIHKSVPTDYRNYHTCVGVGQFCTYVHEHSSHQYTVHKQTLAFMLLHFHAISVVQTFRSASM
jgi:hypothetical protein